MAERGKRGGERGKEMRRSAIIINALARNERFSHGIAAVNAIGACDKILKRTSPCLLANENDHASENVSNPSAQEFPVEINSLFKKTKQSRNSAWK